MSNAVTAYYSKKTGARVGAKYGTRNPNLVEQFVFVEGTVDIQFLDRGHSVPTTLAKARAADEARKAAAAKATAEAAAKTAKKAAKKVVKKKKAAKKAAKKTTRRVKRVKSGKHGGEFAPNNSRGGNVASDYIDAIPTPKAKKKPGSKVAKKVAAKKALGKGVAVVDGVVYAKDFKVGKPPVKKVAKKTAKKVLPASQTGLVKK